MAGALAVVPFSLFFFPTLKNLYKFLIFALGLILPVMIWAYLGDGLDFIAKYFEISVASRAQNQNMSIHPWRNIYLYWLPWSPFFFFSIVSVFMSATMKKFSTEAKIIAILIVYSLSYPIGFSFGAVYFEHYLTPFYPVGAILAGTQLTRIRYFSKVTERGLKIGYQILLVAAIFIATVAPSFHVVKDFAPMKWVHEIQTLPDSEIKGVTKIAFTDLAGDRWYGLANILAKSDFQAIGSFDLSKAAMNDTILITSREESPHPSWKQITCFYVDGYRAYVAKNVTICERQ